MCITHFLRAKVYATMSYYSLTFRTMEEETKVTPEVAPEVVEEVKPEAEAAPEVA